MRPRISTTGWSLTATQAQVAAALAPPAAEDRTIEYVYDAKGQMRYQTDAAGYVTEYKYDQAGRTWQTIRHAAGYVIGEAASADAVVTTMTYDALGRMTDVLVAGVTTHLEYDAAGRVADTYYAYGSSDESRTHNVYDDKGRLQSQTRAYLTTEAQTRTYTYDQMDRMLTDTLVTGPSTGLTTTYTYDDVGRVKSVTTPDLKSTQNEYDALGNLVKVTDPNLGEGYFYYDAIGRLVLQVDPEGYATATIYDHEGGAVEVVRYSNKVVGTYSASVRPVVVTTATGGIPTILADPAKDAHTVFTRNKLDQVERVTDAMGFPRGL